jgi:two-component system KDP operon response regulator KdpE
MMADDGSPKRVLIVDEDPSIARALRAGMEARGYIVSVCATCRAAIEEIAARPFDVVLLDLGLPDDDGQTVVRRVREWSTVAIIVLTADGHEQRKVEALDDGADDYITKPFSMPELLARVRVAIRHKSARASGPEDVVLEVGDVTIDISHHTCTVAGAAVDLTPKEFSMLSLLARWPGRVVTHRMILHEVWGPEYVNETQYLRTYATNIRKKLKCDPDHPRLVVEPGVGYRLLDLTSTPA